MWVTIPHKCVQFCDPRFKIYEEIRPKDVGGCIFGRFSNFEKCQPEVASDVISRAALVYVGVDVCAKFGDSRSNRSRDIQLPQMRDEQTTMTPVIRQGQNAVNCDNFDMALFENLI